MTTCFAGLFCLLHSAMQQATRAYEGDRATAAEKHRLEKPGFPAWNMIYTRVDMVVFPHRTVVIYPRASVILMVAKIWR
jgi:hypothetical protein